MGYNGKKVGFFLLKSTDAMRDDGSPHGELYNKMKQIEKAHKTLQGKKNQMPLLTNGQRDHL
jgi:hypothetical protein